MKRFKTINAIALVFFIGSCLGCSASKIMNIKTTGKMKNLHGASAYQVRYFSMEHCRFKGDNKKMVTSSWKGLNALFTKTLCKRLKELSKRPCSILGWTDPPYPQGILIEGKFKEINTGNAKDRVWLGLGAGKSSMLVHVSVKDLVSKAKAEFDALGSSGGRGGIMGAADQTTQDLERVAEQIARYLVSGKK